MNESGGALAKLLGVLLVVALVVSVALYAYGTRQQPLEIGNLKPAPANEDGAGATVTLDRDGTLAFATIVRNDGRLPVTLEGVAAATGDPQPLIVTSIGLGDGSDASSAATFAPAHLDPGSGIGIVLVLGVNPGYPCDLLGANPASVTPLPPIALRFSSYGVTGTQQIAGGAPGVTGLTRRACTAAVAS